MFQINFVAMLLYLAVIFTLSVLTSLAFNPFMDSDLHSIDWAGPSSIDQIEDSKNVVVMKTGANEKYKCVLPDTKDSEDDSSKRNYAGPTPDELMESLFQQKTCSYRIESYWTYELCHGKHMKQYHEDKELVIKRLPLRSIIWGLLNGVQKKIKIKKIDNIDLPYFEVNMTDGTTCDLTQQPRKSRFLYVCQPDGRGEIYEFKEVSTCEYEIVVLTAVLCSNPLFKPKNPPVSKIACHAVDGSPDKPTVLKQWDTEENNYQTQLNKEKVIVKPGNIQVEIENVEPATPEPPQQAPKVSAPDTTLGDTTDKQVLRDFLSGSHCLQGGSGWWKHELCYGKYVKQFHEDPNGRTDVFLGYWNEQKHLEWLTNHPSKKPAEIGKRKSLHYLYVDGEVCDLTGKKRLAEVRLKCVPNPGQPHSVSIYLMEPKVCEYILGIESPLFCSILDRADDNGLINNKINV
ncbi:LOW QUALITY PROTEIN: endoplasmic reticulum lectin 1-like [Ylistrum balloti]|uniref:LOW QUALITY PROTEIN: endoplasmic reticulum lectin 1-like n=1 Tax=Ylistrum balloti TaxID=509963 RepID=UPI002905C417|nr:LOW QUALITY PROTEIN: endoplasmic reticulum lectin 1-like [Ylistrum balloti]